MIHTHTHTHTQTHVNSPPLMDPSGTTRRPKGGGILHLLPNHQVGAESGAYHQLNTDTWAVRGHTRWLEGEDDQQQLLVGQVPH